MHLRYMYGIQGAQRAKKPLTAHSMLLPRPGGKGKESEDMKIGFWELVVIVVIAFVFIGPDQLIQKNVVEPLNEIQAPLKEAVAPLTDIKKDIDNSVKDVTKSFTGIGKTSKEEAAKAEQPEEVTELEVEELPEEAPAEAPAAETTEPVKAEEKADAPAAAAPVAEEAAPAAEAAPAEEAKA